MENKKLILYKSTDISIKSELIKHSNAFILPDGTFYLAKGYTGCNPSHQLESSALMILRKIIGYDIRKEECASYFNNAGVNYYNHIVDVNNENFYYLRSILVHYYGYTLFARQEWIKSYNDRNKFFDCSLIPNPKFSDKTATSLQIEMLKLLFELNDDETFCLSNRCQDSTEVLEKVLKHDECHSAWHR